MEIVEIYALCDPETGRERYIGKAKDALKRSIGSVIADGTITPKLRAAVIYAGAKRPELFGALAARLTP